MPLENELQTERLRSIHSQFLKASEEYSRFYHVACRSDNSELCDILKLNVGPLRSLKPEEDERRKREGRNYHLWRTAAWSTHLPLGNLSGNDQYTMTARFGSRTHRLQVHSTIWLGRFDCRFSNQHADVEFQRLAAEVAPDFTSSDHTDYAHWLEVLYETLPHERKELACEDFPPEGVLHVAWLPWNLFLASARAVELLIKGRAGTMSSPTRAHVPVDHGHGKIGNRVPENPEVLRLAKRIRGELSKGGTMIDIARDFTKGDEKKASNLLRQLRRYPHLLE